MQGREEDGGDGMVLPMGDEGGEWCYLQGIEGGGVLPIEYGEVGSANDGEGV